MPILEGVRKARIALGVREGRPVKVGELARRIGCSTSHLVSVENGNRPASPELTALLEDALGVQLSVPDEPPPQPKPQPKPKPRKDKTPRPKRAEDAA